MINLESACIRNLRQYLDSLVPGMSDNDWRELLSIGNLVRLEKGDELYPAAYYHDSVGFLLQGALRSYEKISDREITFNLYLEHDVIVDYESLKFGVPSRVTFKGQESSLLVQFDYQKLCTLFPKYPYVGQLYRQLAELQCKTELDSRRFLLRMDATERYVFLLKSKPAYFQRFSLKDIASYMGVTPTSLSRLRKIYKLEAPDS